jgi:hypothetical protein
MPAEWDGFRFEIGKENSAELTTVRHIAHVPAARRIVEDRRIKAGLVYDQSRLNRWRISVGKYVGAGLDLRDCRIPVRVG